MERKKRNHNEGSIRERADGRFEIRVTAGYDFEIGKPKRISYYAKTKAEAIQKLHEEEYKIHFQKHVDPTSTTFLDWLRLWLETYMKQGQAVHLCQLSGLHRKSSCTSLSNPQAERSHDKTPAGLLQLQAEYTGTFAQNHSESSPLPAQGHESGSAGTLHRFQPL